MRSHPVAFALTAVALAGALTSAGCGGDEDSTPQADRGQAGQGSDTSASQESKPAEARRLARDARDRERERERLEQEERDFDKAFEEAPFDRLLERLPIGEPPLYVEQYITTENSHKVYTAVDRKRFLCQMAPREREQAVADFYRAADRVFRGGGVEDFVQVVTPIAETTERLPALATATRDSVALTARGRGKRSC